MIDARYAVWAVRALGLLALFLVLRFGAGAIVDLIRAPVEEQLNAALANNGAMKSGVDHQNAGIDATKKDGEQRQARSREATKKAGEPEYAHAREIEATPARGETPLARAANRINAEFGR